MVNAVAFLMRLGISPVGIVGRLIREAGGLAERFCAAAVPDKVADQGGVGYAAEYLGGLHAEGILIFEAAETGDGCKHSEERTAGDKSGGDKRATVATLVAECLIL